jgi:hypothetical protein
VAVAVAACLTIVVVTSVLIWVLRPNKGSDSSPPPVTSPPVTATAPASTTLPTESTTPTETTAPAGGETPPESTPATTAP